MLIFLPLLISQKSLYRIIEDSTHMQYIYFIAL
jgi:hypothetical protein